MLAGSGSSVASRAGSSASARLSSVGYCRAGNLPPPTRLISSVVVDLSDDCSDPSANLPDSR
jgi:hypothetical protein